MRRIARGWEENEKEKRNDFAIVPLSLAEKEGFEPSRQFPDLLP